MLVPRPETELVVERCAGAAGQPTAATAPSRVLDLGTGCGAIALALAASRPHVAHRRDGTFRGRAAGGARATPGASASRTWSSSAATGSRRWPRRRFELIVSNPPYIAAGDAALAALRYEPAGALVAGDTGFEALQRLVARCARASGTRRLAGARARRRPGARGGGGACGSGYARVRCHRDLAGLRSRHRSAVAESSARGAIHDSIRDLTRRLHRRTV